MAGASRRWYELLFFAPFILWALATVGVPVIGIVVLMVLHRGGPQAIAVDFDLWGTLAWLALGPALYWAGRRLRRAAWPY